MGRERTTAAAGETRNLLFVTSTLYYGGAQKVIAVLANALSERFRVTVAYCYDSGQSFPFSENVRIRKLPGYNRNAGSLEKMRCIRRQVMALRALKRKLKIDTAVSLGNVSNLINALSKGKEYVVCSERNNPKKSWGRLFFLTEFSYRIADHIVFQTEKIRQLYPAGIRRKSSILKNPLPIPAPAFAEREKKIVTLGRLSQQKNHALLIESFARFREQNPEYTLHLYGEGELREDLLQLIGTLGQNGHIFLEGGRMDALERIRDAEQFVLSSDYEGLSNALLECMAMGIACISTRCGGSEDVIRDGENGLLIETGDGKALTEAMRTLAEDSGLRQRIGRQAMEDMKAYETDLVVKDWEKVIRRGS